jgi:hypothetical protein
MNILSISKLDGVFEIFSDEKTALNSFTEKTDKKESSKKV